jgi:hypothetical protein
MAVRHCRITSYLMDHAVFQVHALYGLRNGLGPNYTLLHFDHLILHTFYLMSHIIRKLIEP